MRMTGAFLSTVLFTIAKIGFVAYVSNANYKVIYGALATIPLFLFWLYLVWNVILFGASLAASLTTFSDYRKYDTDWPKRWEFQLVYRLVGHLWSAQRKGGVLSHAQLLDLEQQASELQIVKLLSVLREQHIVNNDEQGNWLLSRDLDELSLGELYSHGNYFLPLGDIEQLPQETDWDRNFVNCLQQIRESGEVDWERSLRSMYLAKEKEGNAK